MDAQEIIGIVMNSREFKNNNDFFLKNLQNFRNELDKKIRDLSEQFESKSNELNEKYSKLEFECSQLKDEKLKLEFALKDKEREIESAKYEIAGLEKKVDGLKREKTGLEQKQEDLIRELQRNKEVASSKIADLEKEVDGLKREKTGLEQKEQELTQELQEEKRLTLAQKNALEELKIFVEAKKLFDVFNGLSAETKKRLEGIFASSSFEGFISNGVQFDNISMVWKFITRKIIDKDTVDVDGLLQIFKFFFELYNLGFQSPRYALLEPKVGDDFDRNSSAIIGTATTGVVTKVLIPGYKDLKTDEVKKALVMVE